MSVTRQRIGYLQGHKNCGCCSIVNVFKNEAITQDTYIGISPLTSGIDNALDVEEGREDREYWDMDYHYEHPDTLKGFGVEQEGQKFLLTETFNKEGDEHPVSRTYVPLPEDTLTEEDQKRLEEIEAKFRAWEEECRANRKIDIY